MQIIGVVFMCLEDSFSLLNQDIRKLLAYSNVLKSGIDIIVTITTCI